MSVSVTEFASTVYQDGQKLMITNFVINFMLKINVQCFLLIKPNLSYVFPSLI